MSRSFFVVPLLAAVLGCSDSSPCDESLTFSIVGTAADLPPGTYTVALVADGTPAQVSWTIAGTYPAADVALPDGRHLLVRNAGVGPKLRSVRIAIVDADGHSVGPARLDATVSLDGVELVNRTFEPTYLDGDRCGQGAQATIVFDSFTRGTSRPRR